MMSVRHIYSSLFAGATILLSSFSSPGFAHDHEHEVSDTLHPSHSSKIPNIELTDQDGKKVHFFDDLIKGKVVMVNFIFTTCEAVCPMETARMKRVQDMLGDRVGKDIFFYSITIDPDTDTPEVLKAYRKKFDIGPGWTFLTGNEATGRWMKRSSMDSTEVMARILGETMFEWRERVGPTVDFAKAPLRVRPMLPGEKLFKNRCQDCHTLGGGNGVGPDLLGVTDRRDRAWLKSWILAPSKVLANNDPVAKEMVGQYKGLVMPNLSLSDQEVDDVMIYMRQVSREISAKKLEEGSKK